MKNLLNKIIVFFLLFTLQFSLSADSIYTELELQELKVSFAKEESNRNRNWIKDQKSKEYLSNYSESKRNLYKKNIGILENIKPSNIQIVKKEKNLVIISYPVIGRSEYDITEAEIALYKNKDKWKRIFRFEKIDFLYLDEDSQPDLIGSRVCCGNISLEIILSSDGYKNKKIKSPTFDDSERFKIHHGRCNQFQMEGISWDTNKFTKFTFDCKEKKFREIKSF